MCGFAGVIQHGVRGDCWQDNLAAMAKGIQHRGPDDSGVWFDEMAGIGLSHQRLAVMDLTPQGHQPMLSASGRFVLAYNGEVYNFQKLREELEKVGAVNSWRGHSDTEVILAAFELWGIEASLKRFVGMFAFALWDREERILTLTRDRLGEKPLYYGWCGNVFLFGSELKALHAHPSFKVDIDRDVLSLYMRHNYIPTPYSIYTGIKKLLPGGFIQLSCDFSPGEFPVVKHYWTAMGGAEYGDRHQFVGTEVEAVEGLDLLLRDTIKEKMIADVPLGAFLSGGIDSSIVVAIMQAVSNRTVRTFSIGFQNKEYNEAVHAKDVARHLETDHTELYVTPEQAMEVIPRLPLLYDEPFADSSQIPTFLVSEMTRQYVTVALSGDGGDELFGGYNRYFWGRSIWNKIGWMPKRVRQHAADLLCVFSPQILDYLFGLVSPLLPNRLKLNMPGDRLHKLASIMAVSSPDQLYLQLVSHWGQPNCLVPGTKEPHTVLTDSMAKGGYLTNFTQNMMLLDMMSYLPDDILVKVDRAAMGVSLETRVPFLDHRLVEFAWQIPLAMKVRNGQGKWLLRQVLNKYVPAKMMARPKMGFGVPIDSWLRGPLRGWAEELLDEKRLKDEGFFNHVIIREKWQEHQSGKRNWQYHLWDVLMFQAWFERWN